MKNEVRSGHLSHAPMTRKDWGYLAIFLVVAALAGTWMGIELRKPFGIVWEGVLVHQESPIEIIVLKNGQKIVRNKREGFEVRVPDDWKIVPPRADYNAFFADQNDTCKIEVYIAKNFGNLTPEQWIEKGKVNESFLTVYSDIRSPTTLRKEEGVRRVLHTEETGISIAVYVSSEENMYQFVAYPKSLEDASCQEKFAAFLATVRFD